jgi:hypothetical protein
MSKIEKPRTFDFRLLFLEIHTFVLIILTQKKRVSKSNCLFFLFIQQCREHCRFYNGGLF